MIKYHIVLDKQELEALLRLMDIAEDCTDRDTSLAWMRSLEEKVNAAVDRAKKRGA